MSTSNSERFREKMKTVRETYGLTKIDMCRVCGFGDNTWSRYEADSSHNIQASNKKLIKELFNPSVMLELLQDMSEDKRQAMGYRWERAYRKALKFVQDIEREVATYKSKLEYNFIANGNSKS